MALLATIAVTMTVATVAVPVTVAASPAVAGDTVAYAVPASTGFRPLTPTRAVDTRIGQGGTRFGANDARTISLAHLVPAGATAVSLNVTAVSPTAWTFLTVWPSGAAKPETSNLNVVAGSIRPNAVLVGLGPNRTISVANAFGSVDVLVDVMGYTTSGFTGVRPQRLMDTRSGMSGTTIEPGGERWVRVAGVAGVPSDAVAVAVNLTGTGAGADTYLTAWPTGSTKPPTSSLNLDRGATVANLAVVGVGANGRISIGNGPGRVDAIVDVLGWFDRRGDYLPAAPRRVVDTRTCNVSLGPGETRRVVLGSSASTAHVVNVTAVGATGPTFLSVGPAGRSISGTSNLNVADGRAAANTVIVGSGDQGAIDIYNHSGRVHVVVDLFGSFGAPGDPPAPAPCSTTAPSSIERELLDAVNAYRVANGRSSLAGCPRLDRASRDFAQVLSSTGVLSHTGPDGSTPASRAEAAGYGSGYVGENLARNYGSVDAVMRGWIGSDGHRANLLLRDYEHLGLAVLDSPNGLIWVQMFGGWGTCG